MPKFIAVPEDWDVGQAEAYQSEVGAQGYVIGLSESLIETHGKQELPFAWDEPEVKFVPGPRSIMAYINVAELDAAEARIKDKDTTKAEILAITAAFFGRIRAEAGL